MNTQPKVLHVFERWAPDVSGYVTRSRLIVQHQRDLGVADPVVLVSSRQHMLTGGVAPGADIVVPPSRREHLVRRLRPWDMDVGHLARAIAAAIRDTGAEIVHGHFSSGIGRAALSGARRAGVPFVSEVRFDLAGAASAARGGVIAARMERLARRRFEAHHKHADAVVCASHALADLVRPLAAGSPIFVAVNGAEPVDIPDGAADKVREQYGLADRLVIGTATNILAYEGLDRLVAPVAKIDNAALLLVGDGAMRPSIEASAKAAGIPAVFAGRIPPEDVPAHIAAMDIFAIPRRSATITAYASPLKLAEAMAVGSAVVATDQGDIAHMLRDDHGLVLHPDDDKGLLGALQSLADDPDLRARLRQRTRERSRTMTWAATADVYRDIYASVL